MVNLLYDLPFTSVINIYRGKFTAGFTANFRIKNGDKKVVISVLNVKLPRIRRTTNSELILVCMSGMRGKFSRSDVESLVAKLQNDYDAAFKNFLEGHKLKP